MSTLELNAFLNSFQKPANYDQTAWDELIAQSKEIWKAYMLGESWENAVSITCKESYLMLVDTNGKLVIKDDSVLNYVQNEHTRGWRSKLEDIALNAIRDKRYQRAALYFGKAIKVDPKHALNYYRRALVSMKLLNNKAALADLNKAIELQPENENLYLKRAQVYRLLDVDFKAMSDLNKTIKLNANCAEAFEVRGKFRMSLGDRAGARMDLNRSYEIINSRKTGPMEQYGAKAA